MTERTVFIWEGKDKQGRKTNGEINSTTAAIAKAELRRQGIAPDRVKKKSAGISLNGGAKVNAADIALFTRQMATMMRAGVPLVQSFDIVADGVDKPKLATLIRDIRQDVASGNSFASALKRHPTQFDDLFCNLVDAGELSGALETMLDRIATYKEKTESLKAKVRKAMTYPIAVTIVAFIVSGILLIKVVPQFEQVFQGFGAELPAFTKLVISFSEFAQAYWLAITASLIGAGLAVSSLHRRSKALRDLLDRLSLKLPIAGDIITKSSVARYARTLSTTFAAGVPLVDALNSVAGSTGNSVYVNAVYRIRDDVSTGQQLNFSMRSTGVFPNMVNQMVAIGEEAGALDEMLDKSASYYEEQVDNAVDNLTSLMEPVIMGVLGTLIGGLIIAMYLPIFGLGAVVSQ
ncbi:MAG: type II secretion system F family protein [Gammaproteobacteria bacterium]|jgi:type IV pilus assembly protein PilC|nr:type II secretion system F family protein [Gammaproteobacteria bacterium]MCH1550527.1 type II secretion system F family protein [Pseudomonadales bacterium]